ncbi:hypothetical protein LTR78_004362 [Recurvomyces mirabilis]|uniref:Uncharacterized protein n=1 Tax=Recurvomyces mirabilis TaxID=574656 RepID=A0AAE0WQ49_9PEZI|nr:hypothetical protein LTR78_004362 [Recurvomyces mirabilis]KAK5155972.1 hypothetical protein LTS14_005538 [Recurvomyces mirabilis]
MAVPAEKTTRDMNGTYVLNKTLSDSVDELLQLQNIGWIIRKAVAYSTVTVVLKQYADDGGKAHLDQVQRSTGGITNQEARVLDWEPMETKNAIWGQVKGQNRFIKVADLTDDFLKQDWDGDEVVEATNESMTDTWKAVQVMGFAIVDGKRRQVRRIVGSKGQKVIKVRQVYDWQE